MKVQPNAFIQHALSVKAVSARFRILHLKECKVATPPSLS